jgi:rhomboid family protein
MLYNIPPVTRTLIIINVIVFLIEMQLGDRFVAAFALWPIGTGAYFGGYPTFQPWQIITYSFLHGGLTHLLFNMFALFMFGSELERVFRARRFVNLYFVGVITAAAAQLVVASVFASQPYPTIGASGGIFGLLLAYALYFPNRTVILLIPPIPMPARVFVLLYGALELVLGVTGSEAGVAHFAHLGGMLGAWLLVRYWRGQLPFGRR